MSSLLSPSTCATSPTLTASEVTTFHPCAICNHETGSATLATVAIGNEHDPKSRVCHHRDPELGRAGQQTIELVGGASGRARDDWRPVDGPHDRPSQLECAAGFQQPLDVVHVGVAVGDLRCELCIGAEAHHSPCAPSDLGTSRRTN